MRNNQQFTNQKVFLFKSEGFLGHDVIKVLSGDFSSISGGSLQHLLQLGGVHGLTQLFSDSFNIVDIDEACSIVVEQVENLIDAVLNQLISTLDYLSPNRAVMPSKNYSKSISLPSAYKSAIILKIVGFLDSKPKLCMAAFNSRGSILPVASVSNKLKASLSSSISS